MATDTDEHATASHGGRLIAQRLKAHGVTTLFTLSGGHLFSLYDGCVAEDIDIVDVRHEQTAGFAAEGWAMVSLQEIDHVPFVRPLTKYAATPDATAEIPQLVDDALRAALTPHSGPA